MRANYLTPRAPESPLDGCPRRVTYDWHTDAGEAGIVTARIAKERPRSAGPGRSRPDWMGARTHRFTERFTGARRLRPTRSVTVRVAPARSRSASTADSSRG